MPNPRQASNWGTNLTPLQSADQPAIKLTPGVDPTDVPGPQQTWEDVPLMY